MLVRATRTASVLTMRAIFYGVLFLAVVIAHLALTGMLQDLGWTGSAAITASGAAVLALVLVAVNIADWVRDRLMEGLETRRMRQRLPSGPCCVVWRSGEGGEDTMPWETVGPVRARYPKLARRLGIEGMAIVEFEVSTEGRAKNISCVESWPSDVFYEAAREALSYAQFQPKYDEHVRFGASYQMPFVFRIAGASSLQERGQRARRLRPALHAARQFVQRLQRRSA